MVSRTALYFKCVTNLLLITSSHPGKVVLLGRYDVQFRLRL